MISFADVLDNTFLKPPRPVPTWTSLLNAVTGHATHALFPRIGNNFLPVQGPLGGGVSTGKVHPVIHNLYLYKLIISEKEKKKDN